ncbi:MAG TPA: ABC transporter substrate-binding protein [Anaerolineae bacterium]|nr:ABC transporter substrate-binding protein [Anaerolineae bacterium]
MGYRLPKRKEEKMLKGNSQWKAALVALLILVVPIVVACVPPPTPVKEIVKETVVVEKPVEKVVVVTPTPVPGRQVLIVALARAPVSLDPADHRTRESETVIRNMFDGLVTRDTRSGVHLELAESLKWLDEKTLEVKLRKGVKFHDGEEMTADDVVFTFERIIGENKIEYPEPHTSPRKGLIAPLESVEKVDDYTVRMHFSGPWPVAMQMLVHQQIVPKHYLEEVGTKGFTEHPIGTGPFKFVSAKGMDEIVMERFDDYYGGAPDLTPVGPACVEGAVFRAIPEASTRAAALLAGEVDIIQRVPPEMVDLLKQTPGIQVKTAPGTRPIWMEMNVNKPPFDDVRVRQALNYAVDKDLLIETVFNGMAQPLPGVLSPLNNFVHPDLKPYPYDKDKALALLADAGWQDTDGDGTLDKDGNPFSFVIDCTAVMRTLAEAVAGQLRDIGIDAGVRVWEYSVVKPMLLAGERTAWMGDWGDSAFDPVGHMEAKWHSYYKGTPYGRGNFSTYANPRVDELIEAGETEGDVEKRHAIYNEAQEILYEEAPAVFLVLPEAIEAASTRVQNWEPASDSRFNLHDVCLK